MTKLRQKNDEGINYEDIPATTQEFWEDAEVFMPQHKVHISLRLDENIIEYFKQEGSGYQSRINAVLKAYVNTHSRHQLSVKEAGSNIGHKRISKQRKNKNR